MTKLKVFYVDNPGSPLALPETVVAKRWPQAYKRLMDGAKRATVAASIGKRRIAIEREEAK